MPRRQGGVESMETTRNLPDDILEEEILVRVPVKFLVRWKCVCKHWYALFGDYDFTMKHYRFQYAHHGTLPLFLDRPISYPGPGRDQTEFFVLSKHGADDVVLNVTPDFHRDIPPPFANEYQLKLTSRCMGIVNGVIGLQWGNTCLALWNPATGEFKDVPRWPVMPDNKVAEEFCGRILGLGFDVQSHDFKILGLIDFDGAGVEPTVYEYHLYSLKANSWKKVKDPDCHNREHKRYADGRGCRDCSFSLTLGKYKETLALFVSNSMKNSEDGYVEIWAVTRFREDDHGVPLSWHLAVRVSHTPSCIGLYVLKFRECGDLLLMIQYGRFGEEVEGCLYDPSTRTFNNLGVTCCSSFTYVESLFSVTTTIKDA